MASARTLIVLQHTQAEFLGLIEEHLEGRGIPFQYVRPFTGTATPATAFGADGVVLLGGGAWRASDAPRLPSAEQELRLVRDALKRRRPVIGFGVGAQLLCVAAGGGVESAPLDFSVGEARRARDGALGGFMPAAFPICRFMRDRPVPPEDAEVLARDERGQIAAFRCAGNCIGFTFHPGFKTAMAEDLVMELEEGPEDPAPTLEALRLAQGAIADALVPLMTGLVLATGLMEPLSERERLLRQVTPIRRA